MSVVMSQIASPRAGPADPAQRLAAARVIHGVRIDPPPRHLGRRAETVQRGRVALDGLADAVADRLQQMIAGGQPVGRGGEAAGARGRGQRVGRMHGLVRNPHPAAGEQLVALDPQDREVRMSSAESGRPRQRVDVDQPVAELKVVEAAENERLNDPLGHERLDALHDARCPGPGQVQGLAERYHDRP